MIQGEDDATALREALNQTDAPALCGQTIADAFEAVAARAATAPSILHPDGALSYGELDRRADQVAHALRAQGVVDGELVGVFIERSADAVIALLGVVKAGAAWLAIDPALPAARVALMLEDARLAHAIARSADRAQLPVGLDVLILDELPAARRALGPPPRAIGPASPAYAIYTSGSTGRPKCVVLGHEGAVNMALGHAARLRLRERPRVLQFFSLAFDAAVFEVLVPLLTGGTMVIASRDTLMSPVALTAVLREHRVQSIQLPPAVLAALDPEQLPHVETVLIGGEVYPAELVARFRAKFRVLNFYGPSETTVSATCCELARDTPASVIGRPLPNVRAYVLDAQGAPQAVGAAGELYIGGVGVGAGYLHRPELTRERFLPDPFAARPGARMYRTGDRARLNADGELEFLGRADTQVKVRGFRVELGEVEALLAQCAGVAAAAAAVDGDELVAFVQPADDAEVDLAAVVAELQASAPHYLVPSRLARLAALPRTANGKLDRGALPIASAHRLASAGGEASTAHERAVLEVVAEVLGLAAVGVADRFLALGGHSLAALKIASRLRERLGCDVRLSAVVEAASLGALAASLATAPPRGAVARDHGLALQPGQQALWMLQQAHPHSVAYNVPWVSRLRGPLDRAALDAALAGCVARHVPLGARIAVRDGAPRLLPADAPMAIAHVDDDPLPDDRAARLRARAEALIARPFELARELPIRIALVRFADDDHGLIIVLHHVAADGWSFGVLARELRASYAAHLVGEAPPLPSLDAHYARWLGARASEEDVAEDLAFWRTALAGAPPVIRLPSDRPRPPVRDARGGRVRLAIDAAEVAALHAVAGRAGATLFHALAAAVAVLLVRHGAEDDLVLGTVVANREHADVEGLVGYFAGALPIRIDATRDPSVHALIERVRRATLDALDHRRIPFDALVRGVNPPRGNAGPLYQVMLVLQDADAAPLALPGLAVDAIDLHPGAAKLDLSIELDHADGGLAGWIEYSADIFDAATVERLGQRLGCIVRAFIADPAQPVSRVRVIDDAEQARMLRDARPQTRFAADATLPALFAAHVARAPQRIAVRYAADALSYGELAETAEAIARALAARGVGPGQRVALVLDTSLALIPACLGVLLAGAAYVPIDPSYPAARRDFMLADSAAALAIIDEGVDLGVAAPTLALDRRGQPLTRTPDAAPVARGPAPHDLAYVIYTSGTTGQPKGVRVTHHNVVRLMRAADARFAITADDVWSMFHSYAFDFSVWEIWGALAFGGTLVVVPHLVARAPDAFHALVRDAGITVLSQTPSAFAQWMHVDVQRDARDPLALRYVVFGGEPLNFRSLARWLALRGAAAPCLVNMYGITETTVHSTFRVVTHDDVQHAPSYVGEPLADLAIYLVDRHGALVPDGAPGEIWVAGDGVAAGYLNRPELTAERFFADPFAAADEPRQVYRSGDLARRNLAGDLEYLGRLDNQVKLRGFRIELEELEACLASHPAVRMAAAAVREGELVAWIASDGGQALAVRDHVRARLPAHMVPSRILELPALPRTPTGKTDKAALPLGETAARAIERVAPRTLLEELIARVWQDVLGVPEIGIDEAFFDIGGHSLLATQVVMRLRRMLGAELPVRWLFEHVTIAALAAAIEQSHAPHDSDASAPRLLRDAVLDAQIRPTPSAPRSPRTILLTGATGFLGGYLLDELLRAFPAAELWCLVRCRSAADGHARVLRNLASYQRPGLAEAARIRVIPGDLAQPELGLADADARDLVRHVDAIYHNGAQVSFLESYETLKAPNVRGTEALLRLASRDRAIPFHHVSSTGVFGTPAYRETIDAIAEHDDLQLGLGVGHIGYVQSKWVAERMVWQAGERGLPITVFRCGLIMGDSRTGHTNLRDFPSMLIKGCLELGAAYDLRKVDNFIPVDIASRAIVHISRQPTALGKPFHVVNPHHVAFAAFWDHLRALGHRLERLDYAGWLARFFAQPGGPERNPIYPLISLFVDKVPSAGRSVIELFEDQPTFATTNFEAALAGSDIACPPIDRALVATWMAFYRQMGFVPEPAA